MTYPTGSFRSIIEHLIRAQIFVKCLHRKAMMTLHGVVVAAAAAEAASAAAAAVAGGA